MGRGTGTTVTPNATQARSGARNSPQTLSATNMNRLKSMGGSIIPLQGWFYLETDYETEKDCYESGCADAGVCRCRTIYGAHVESTDRLGEDLLQTLKDEAQNQETGWRSFRRGKIYRETEGGFGQKFVAFARRRKDKDPHKEGSRTFDPVLLDKIKNLDETNKDDLIRLVREANFTPDDFEVYSERGYYGEELGDTVLINKEKLAALSDSVEEYIRAT